MATRPHERDLAGTCRRVRCLIFLVTTIRLWAIGFGIILLCSVTASAGERKVVIPVDELPSRLCDVQALTSELVLQGNIQYPERECLKADMQNHCVSCRATPVVATSSEVENAIPLTVTLEPVQWDGVADPATGTDCLQHPPYAQGETYLLRGRLSANLPSQFLGVGARTPYLTVPIALTEPPRPVTSRDTKAIPVEQVFSHFCHVPPTRMTIRGIAQIRMTACTAVLNCPGCCNDSCAGVGMLTGERVKTVLGNYSCSGSSCNMTCPGLTAGWQYDATGTFKLEPPGELSFHVDSLTPVEAPGPSTQ